mmetsp:Transcript_96543/g.300663  ORF Transcript_96543/g.300663 Transcript_96543/m.300663 type:complete len:142 (+) Transcript_96543:94-519(+)
MSVSPDLIWECVKDHSSFIRKSRDAPVMTAEPGNLCGLNSFKYSGLAARKVVGVSVRTTGKRQTVVLTKRGRPFRPPSLLFSTGLKKEAKKGVEAIARATEGAFYRPDLKEAAVRKYLKIRQSFKKNKRIPKNRKSKADGN